jgi:hypothetical protein
MRVREQLGIERSLRERAESKEEQERNETIAANAQLVAIQRSTFPLRWGAMLT